MTQHSIVAVLMPAAAFRGANRYFPPPYFVSLPFDELMSAPRLLILKDHKIGQEVSGGVVLVHGLAVRVRHGPRL